MESLQSAECVAGNENENAECVAGNENENTNDFHWLETTGTVSELRNLHEHVVLQFERLSVKEMRLAMQKSDVENDLKKVDEEIRRVKDEIESDKQDIIKSNQAMKSFHSSKNSFFSHFFKSHDDRNGWMICQEYRFRRPWSQSDKKILYDEVINRTRRRLLAKVETSLKYVVERLDDCRKNNRYNSLDAKVAYFSNRIELLNEEKKGIQDATHDKLVSLGDVAKLESFQGIHLKYSPYECEKMWNLYLSPGLNQNPWNETEENELMNLVKKYEWKNWREIGKELNCGRSDVEIFTHYRRNLQLKDNSSKIRWTPEMDEKLKTAVEDFRDDYDGSIKWNMVLSRFPDCIYDQIFQRYIHVLNPDLKKGYFSEDEKEIMEKALAEGRTASYIHGLLGKKRSLPQINAHLRMLRRHKNSKSGKWSRLEVEALRVAIDNYGVGDWLAISKDVKTRSAPQCRVKYKLDIHQRVKEELKEKRLDELKEKKKELEKRRAEKRANREKRRAEKRAIREERRKEEDMKRIARETRREERDKKTMEMGTRREERMRRIKIMPVAEGKEEIVGITTRGRRKMRVLLNCC